jgi:hypothetical protein
MGGYVKTRRLHKAQEVLNYNEEYRIMRNIYPIRLRVSQIRPSSKIKAKQNIARDPGGTYRQPA